MARSFPSPLISDSLSSASALKITVPDAAKSVSCPTLLSSDDSFRFGSDFSGTTWIGYVILGLMFDVLLDASTYSTLHHRSHKTQFALKDAVGSHP